MILPGRPELSCPYAECSNEYAMRWGGCAQMRTPQKGDLERLWARAGQAGQLRLEVESVRVAEQERALAEARQHLEQWDHLVSTPSAL